MHRIHTLIFILIISIAVYFRFTGLNWDQNAHLHPDERFLTMVATNIEWPQRVAQYFDTRISPANPHNRGFSFYVYGTYPVHLTKLIAQLVNKDTYDGITLVGRALSGLIDLITLIFVFLIAKHISSTRSALFAMFLYGVMVLPIQLSHFFTVDPYATLFLTISLYLLIRGRIGMPLGIAVGLAISAKISSILILPIAIVAWFVKQKKLSSGFWFLFAMVVTIRIAYPYLFDGWRLNSLILDNWKQLKVFDGPLTAFPPALQWIGVPFWQPTMDMIVWGLGLPLGVVALLSLLRRPNLILTSWVILVIVYQSFQFAKAMRYLYPVYPAIAILTGVFLSRIHLHRYFVTLLLGLLLFWPLAFTSIYHRPHTRVAASKWIYTNIAPGAVIAWEHWDDPLPLSLENNHIGIYKTVELPMYDPDTRGKWQNIIESLIRTDYLILSSNRVYGGIGHAKERYPQTNRYYQLLFSGQLGFEKIAEFTSRPYIFVDDNAEESFTVYDHPKVTIFRNNGTCTANQLFTILYE